jgi:cation/acetate symporter
MGADPGFAPFALVSAAFALLVLSALYAHARRAIDFYVADHRAVARFNGLAGASGLAGLLAIGLAGGAYDTRAGFLLAALGLSLGFLLFGFLIAPGLRNVGAYTAGDFIGARFGGGLARLAWAGVTFTVSFLLFVAQMKIAAPLVATLLGLDTKLALYLVAGATAMAALPGGMRSLSWTQVIQYLVIGISCIVPALFFASGGPTAQSAIAGQFATLLADSLPALDDGGAAGWALPLLLFTLGAASLPQLSARALAAPSARESATSTVWTIFFLMLVIFAGFVLFQLLSGAIAPDAAASTDLATQETAVGPLQIAALLALLPSVLAGLLLAGTLAALLSLGQAALFSAATALSHDVWDEVLDRRGPEGRRIMVARLILVGVAAVGVMLASLWPGDAAATVNWALALAAAGCFVPLVLGLWWRRSNEIGAIAGILSGFSFTALVFLMQQHIIPDAIVSSGWADVGAPTAAVAGVVMSFAVTVGLSLATPAPDKETQELLRPPSRRRRVPTRERPA